MFRYFMAFAFLLTAHALVGCASDGGGTPDGSSRCGNGVLDPGERCDPGLSSGQPGHCPSTCDDKNVCTADSLNVAGTCEAFCAFQPITGCSGEDGCCPAGCTAATDDDCSATCGNGSLEVPEQCDTAIDSEHVGACPTDCDDGNACTVDTLLNGGTCGAICSSTAISECFARDGCCPTGCNATTDSDCSATCGNGVLESPEKCDTDIASGQSGACPTECDDDNACTLDTLLNAGTCGAVCSSTAISECLGGDGCCPTGCNATTDSDCSATCGNGVLESPEKCDTDIASGQSGACPTECDDSDACTLDTLLNGGTCGAVCSSTAISQCVGGDGCCPLGCSSPADSDCEPVSYSFSASNSLTRYPAAHAADGDEQTEWCPALTPAPTTLLNETFDYWWEVTFARPLSVGSVHMRSGRYESDELQGDKIRDFVWAYQKEGTSTWTKIAETDGYANRYQLIFRFSQLQQVKGMRLLIRPRDKMADQFVGTPSSGPCLREVAFYPERLAPIKTQPWIATVATWQFDKAVPGPGHAYATKDYGNTTNALTKKIREAFQEVCGCVNVDAKDDFWIGEFNKERLQAAEQDGAVWIGGVKKTRAEFAAMVDLDYSQYQSWITHEPKPAGFILSGNYMDFKDRNPDLLAGFYSFLRKNRSRLINGHADDQYAIYGNCGGHQLLAMAMNSSTFDAFRTEFSSNPTPAADRAQFVGSCGNIAAMPTLMSTKPLWCNEVSLSGDPCCGLSSGWGSFHSCCREVVPGNTPTQTTWVEFAINRKGGKATQTNPLTSTPHPWSQAESFRNDILYLGVSDVFFSPNYNWDYVNPATISTADVDLIAAHSTNVPMDMQDDSRINNHFALMQAMKYKLGPLYSSQFHPDNGIGAADPTNQRIIKNYVLIALSHLVHKQIANWSATTEFNAEWPVGQLSDLDQDTAWCSTAADAAPAVTITFTEPTTVKHLLVVEGYEETDDWTPTGYGLSYREKGSTTWKTVTHSVTPFEDSQVKAATFPNDGYWCGTAEFKGTPTTADWRLGQGDSCALQLSDKIAYNGAGKKIVCSNGETIAHRWQELNGATDGNQFCRQNGGTCNAVHWLYCKYASNYARKKLITFGASINPEQLRLRTARGDDGVCLREVLALPDLNGN